MTDGNPANFYPTNIAAPKPKGNESDSHVHLMVRPTESSFPKGSKAEDRVSTATRSQTPSIVASKSKMTDSVKNSNPTPPSWVIQNKAMSFVPPKLPEIENYDNPNPCNNSREISKLFSQSVQPKMSYILKNVLEKKKSVTVRRSSSNSHIDHTSVSEDDSLDYSTNDDEDEDEEGNLITFVTGFFDHSKTAVWKLFNSKDSKETYVKPETQILAKYKAITDQLECDRVFGEQLVSGIRDLPQSNLIMDFKCYQ
jgi:hypothetical protein